MAGRKRCMLNWRQRKGEEKRIEEEKGGQNRDQNLFFFGSLCTALVCAEVMFLTKKQQLYSELSYTICYRLQA